MLDELIGIDLQDSFVLGWSWVDSKLVFELELSIWPESKHYVTPKADEYTCYRKAQLIFTTVTTIIGLKPQSSVHYTTDIDGSRDYGNIDSLAISPNGYKMSGECGLITIECKGLELKVRT
ncbi:hypothetical protein [Photobacterium alginatilyticum]|uniref:hypothetical protein n=1 Tax=Photobacterium alginatilyticum TaxID=1775171 RepID=UPI001369DE34|nr:hypothetical protein [Photobacterium alginatilyticum]